MGRRCHARGLRLGQQGIGGDDGDGRGLARATLVTEGLAGVEGRRGAEPAELIGHLEGRGPELRPVAHGDLAKSIDHHERANRMPRGQNNRGRAKPPFEIGDDRPRARPCSAKREGVTSCRHRLGSEPLVGVFAPVLVAPVDQVEDDRPRHDGHQLIAHGKAASLPAQPIRHSRGSIEPEGRAPGKDQRIDLLHRLVRGQQVRFSRARRTAHDMDRRNEGSVAHQHARAGLDPVILGMADPEAGHIGDQVAGAGLHCHGLSFDRETGSPPSAPTRARGLSAPSRSPEDIWRTMKGRRRGRARAVIRCSGPHPLPWQRR